MKSKRDKIFKKYMSVYRFSFGFRSPFQVLIAGDFCLMALDQRLHLATQMAEVFGGPVKPMTSACVINELRNQDQTGAVLMLKRIEKRRCPHTTPIAGNDCLLEIIGKENTHRYAIAVQDWEVRRRLGFIGGLPVLFIQKDFITMEEPSEETKKLVKLKEKAKQLASVKNEVERLTTSLINTSTPVHAEVVQNRRRKAQAPNPLSVKKKKKVMVVQK